MQQRRVMGTEAVSRMLSTHLYYRRSFPFYTFNIVGGLDGEGLCEYICLLCCMLRGDSVLRLQSTALDAGMRRWTNVATRGIFFAYCCIEEGFQSGFLGSQFFFKTQDLKSTFTYRPES